jgi:hypothetical protein
MLCARKAQALVAFDRSELALLRVLLSTHLGVSMSELKVFGSREDIHL